MDYFGLKDIDALPKPKDFKEPDNEIGEKAPIDEDRPIAEDTPPIEASIPAPPNAGHELIQEEANNEWEAPQSPIIEEDLPPSSGEIEITIPEEDQLEEEIPAVDEPDIPSDIATTPVEGDENASNEPELADFIEEATSIDEENLTPPTPVFIPSIDVGPDKEQEEISMDTTNIEEATEEITNIENTPLETSTSTTPTQPNSLEEQPAIQEEKITEPGSVFQEVISIIAPPLFADEEESKKEEIEENMISGDTTTDDFEV